MAYKSYKGGQQKKPDGGDVFRLRDEYAIPRHVTDLHIKIQPYLSQALISAYNEEEEMANESRRKFAFYFCDIVTTTIMLPKVKELFEERNPENKDIKVFILKIAKYARDKIKSSELLEMYLSYAEILSEAGLLEAYNRKETVNEMWEGGF